MKKQKLNHFGKKAQFTELIEETLQQGHCCYVDSFEISLINKADMAIAAQNISLERGITPKEAEKFVANFYSQI